MYHNSILNNLLPRLSPSLIPKLPIERTNPLALLLLICGITSTSPTFASDRPNVVVILSDDQGWGDLSLNGNTNLSTPHIDSLARDGARFDRFYVCPVCSPTRAEFLTGRYHPRSRVSGTSSGSERMDLDEKTIAETFQAAGYHTAAFGKWHNGMQYPYHPNGRGFAEYYGFCSGHWGHYFDWMLEHNGKLVRGDGFCIDDFTNHALQFMDDHQDEPFFVYLPYNTPHAPMQVPDEFWDRFKNKDLQLLGSAPKKEDIEHTKAALAMCENIDWNVGRVLKKLEELKLAENTIVVYFCDNGPNGDRWNGGMKGRKGSTDEGGVRSPLLIRWPQQIPAGKQVKEISAAIDLLPTLADFAGIEIVSEHELDGVSLKLPLTQDSYTWSERIIFSHWNKRVSARTQNFRLDHQGQLFQMTEDPGQTKDVSQKYPQITEELKVAVAHWKENVLAGYDQDDRPFVIGHPDFPETQIPARDGTAHGNIKRSNKAPNCSYYTNWTSTQDKITWAAELPAAGTFDVEIYYTCREENLGCTLQLSFGKETLSATVDRVNDPPLLGAEQDRVPRPESYVKEFKPLHMGRIALPQGAGTLTLQATHIPGNEAIEFRLMMLRRVE